MYGSYIGTMQMAGIYLPGCLQQMEKNLLAFQVVPSYRFGEFQSVDYYSLSSIQLGAWWKNQRIGIVRRDIMLSF